MEAAQLKGFVYLWSQRETGKYYVGSHLGSPNDGYICSSKLIEDNVRNNPRQWHRDILVEGQIQTIRQIEREIIAALVKDPLCLNQAISSGAPIKFKDLDLTHDAMTEEQRLMAKMIGEDYE
jgi:hypothetical protein